MATTKKAASKKTTAKKAPKKAPKKAAPKKKAAKKAAPKKSAKGRRTSEPPGVKGPQSGKAAGGAPPFATANGKPANTGGAPRNLALVSSAPPVDEGGPGWDIDQTEVPRGGTVTKADAPSDTSGGGGLGNGGALPFKNLR